MTPQPSFEVTPKRKVDGSNPFGDEKKRRRHGVSSFFSFSQLRTIAEFAQRIRCVATRSFFNYSISNATRGSNPCRHGFVKPHQEQHHRRIRGANSLRGDAVNFTIRCFHRHAWFESPAIWIYETSSRATPSPNSRSEFAAWRRGQLHNTVFSPPRVVRIHSTTDFAALPIIEESKNI